MNISQRLRTCAKHTALDAVIELLNEAADEIDRLKGAQPAEVTLDEVMQAAKKATAPEWQDVIDGWHMGLDLMAFARAILALRPQTVQQMSMGRAVMFGDELYAGIMEDEVREVKNSVLIEFQSRAELSAFLRWHDGITAQTKKEGE